MKSLLSIAPILTWKEPREFVRKNRPFHIFYGWVQFRIMLYLMAAVIICWGLSRLNPKHPDNAPNFIECLGLGLFLGAFVAYGVPLITRLAPSIVRLYPNYLEITQGMSFHCFRFGLISNCRFLSQSNGWILKLLDLDLKEVVIAIPNGKIKSKVESAFSAAGVSQSGLSPVAIARRKEADEKFQLQIKSYYSEANRYDLSTAKWFIGFLILNFILDLIVAHYISKNSPVNFVLIAVFFATIFGYAIIIIRYKKRLGRALGLACPHCSRISINQVFMQRVARAHTCGYCGKLLHPLEG